MNDILIMIAAGEEYVTNNPEDAYGIRKGQINIYIAPIQSENHMLGKRQFLFGVSENMPDYEHLLIPAYTYTDVKGVQWRFIIKAMNGDAVLIQKTKWAFPKIKKEFINLTDVKYNDVEGYEGCLRSYYIRKRLEEELIDIRPATMDDSLYFAFDYLQKKAHFLFPNREDLLAKTQGELTPFSIAQASNLHCRLVELPDKWYHSDCGMLIAYSKEYHPLALYPNGSHEYIMFDPKTALVCRVTKKEASDLLPYAYHISYTLPNHPVKRSEFFRFIASTVNTSDFVELFIWGFVGAIVGLFLPILNQKVYGNFIPMGNYTMLSMMCIMMCVIMLGNVTFSFAKKMLELRISKRTGYIVQDAAIHRFIRFPYSFFHKYSIGDLSQKVCMFEAETQKIVSTIVVTAFSTVFAVVPFIQMLCYSSKLTLWSVFLLCAFCLLIYISTVTTYRLSAECMELEGQLRGLRYQYINGIEKIRLTGAENRALERYEKAYGAKQEKTIKRNRRLTMAGAIEEASGTIITMIMYYIVVQLLTKDSQSFSAGQYMGFSSAYGMFSSAIMGMTKALCSFRLDHRATLEYIDPILTQEIDDESGKEAIVRLNGKIEIENLSFSYEAEALTLKNINYSIKPGEYVGIVGESGSGKSTLFRLLMGFEDPCAGHIRFDGRDLSTINKKTLRQRMGVVLQNGKLLSGTIKDNIAISTSHIPLRKIKDVVKKVGLEDTISSLPMGLKTIISENSCTISGGEKQRILLARALCGEHDILLFDEATSALDNITQSIVCDTLKSLSCTRIVIAHRLSTVKQCDTILVLDKGELVQWGPYDELVKDTTNHFYQLAKRQMPEEVS